MVNKKEYIERRRKRMTGIIKKTTNVYNSDTEPKSLEEEWEYLDFLKNLCDSVSNEKLEREYTILKRKSVLNKIKKENYERKLYY